MSKKALDLDSLVNPEARPAAAGLSQRGQEEAKMRRLSLSLDAAAYRRLRLHAVDCHQTHQDILYRALIQYLDSCDAQARR